MDLDNGLWQLGNLISDAKDLVRMAEDLAIEILGGPDVEDPAWPAMEVLVGKLAAIRQRLAKLPGDEIGGAIVQAGEALDEGGDRMDGLSY